MRILLLSAYDTLSHRYWRESLVEQFPEYQWTVLQLAPRYFNFRVRTNPLSWLEKVPEQLAAAYDLVIATSLVDISTLRGLVPSLAQTPLWVYCHENQFAYPSSKFQKRSEALKHDIDVKMVFLYSCLCADWISFNSDWNRSSAIQGLSDMLQAFPEKYNRQFPESLLAKSNVLPVPLGRLAGTSARNAEGNKKSTALQIVWNHRWEYDKGPEYLLAFVQVLEKQNIPVALHIVGQQFRQQPEVFITLKQFCAAQCVSVSLATFGYIESRREYECCLRDADIVLSTAVHDFQGLSVLEAVQHGCLPLLPNCLAYPEIFDECYLYHWDDDVAKCAEFAVAKLLELIDCQLEVPDLSLYEWPALEQQYRQQMLSISGRE